MPFRKKTAKSDNSIITGAIYARYSSHSQKEESIEQQIEECTAFAEANGVTVTEIYADKAISGRTDRRNEFQRMMRDAERRKFQVVIAYKSNRIARNMLNALQYEAKLDTYGIKTLYAKEEFGNTAAGRFALRTMMNVNQFYSENMSEDIKRGMKDNAESCKINGVIPYGFKNNNGHYAIDEPRAAIVREIFSKVASDIPFVEILNDLNSRGIRTKTGKAWNKNSFHRMLVNERYIGVYEHSGIRVADGIPAIVDKEIFYTVQDKLKQRNQTRRSPNSEYLLTGKMFCGNCGRPMIGICGTSCTGQLHYYYACQGKRLEKCCDKENIPRDMIEQLVVDLARTCISKEDVTRWLVDGFIKLKQEVKKNSPLPMMESELAARKKALANVMKAIEAGIFNDTTAERMKELENDIQNIERSISIGKLMYDEKVDGERMEFYLEKLRAGTPDNPKYRKELINVLVKRVRLWDDRIEIEFNFTGTDGDNNYRVVTKFLESQGSGTVRMESPEADHAECPYRI